MQEFCASLVVEAPDMKLYDMVKAPNPRRVRMFLAEKGIEIERVEIDIPSGANLAPAYLAINPRGVVPTLQFDDGSILDESVAICRYFELEQPEPNLMGRDSLEQARIESWQRRMEFDGLFAIAMAFRNGAPQFSGRAAPGVGGTFEQVPDLIPRGHMLTQRFLNDLNARLSSSAYVAGSRFTIADITAYVCVDFARWIKIEPDASHTALHSWRAALKMRPSANA
jgi:glutathione S-transferase